ncbi:MAG TPA: TorF family putative porin [Rhodocyclaceae bacterium]|nr:TorF family putative porin [Rhodocyclaceae bacterium]
MKKSVIALALVSGFAALPAFAEEAAGPHTFTGNVGIVTDYLFRGISQSHGQPAIQGGFDYSHSSGFYVGIWASSISWVSDAQNRSVPTEIDVYGGYKNTFGGGDWNYDIGYATYNYPGTKNTEANLSANANTQELYGAIGWKFLTLKYSHTTSSHFVGWYGGDAGGDTSRNTRGSGYLELNANYDLGNGWNILGHLGHQKVKNYNKVGDTDASYSDWKIGVTKDLGFGVLGLAYSDTTSKGTCNKDTGGTNAYCWGVYNGTGATNFRNASKGQAVLSFSKTF